MDAVMNSSAELEDLRRRLAEAEDMLRAIRAGEVDAIVVNGGAAPAAVYTLKSASDPYRQLIEQMSEGALTLSTEGVILYCNAAFARMLQRPRERVIGGLIAEHFAERTANPRASELLARTAHGGYEIQLRTAGGEVVHTLVSSTRLTVDGEVLHCLVVTDLSRQELRLVHEAIVGSSADAIFSIGRDGAIASWNAAAERLLGYTPHQAIGGDIAMLLPLEQREQLPELLERVAYGDVVRFDARCFRKDGGQIEMSVGMSAISTVQGANAIAVIARDITERKLAEAQIQFLMREADHRAKNMLSVVQAIANLSAFQGDTGTFVKRFGERLVALSECHDLLVQSKWASVDLEQLIRRHLDCYMIGRESRISIGGPALRLAETAAKPISMALHELATNASKYGAFSSASGALSVSWRITESNFELLWKEQNGPPPPAEIHHGFGNRVMTQMLALAIKGAVRLEYPPAGCIWQVLAPLDRIVADLPRDACDHG